MSPAVSVDPSDGVHLAWDDTTPGDSEIYYRMTTDGGTTWTPAEKLTMNSGSSWAPAITVDSLGNIHLVWFDDTPGNYEIYYKKGN
jgi:hypothetical protein